MPRNDDYIKSLERQFPQEELELSHSLPASAPAKDNGAKIVVMFLIGLLALALLIFVIKEIVLFFVGLAALGVLIGVFFSAHE